MCLSHHTTASQIYIENLLAHQHWRQDFWFQCLAHSHNHFSYTRTNSFRSFSFGVASFSCNRGVKTHSLWWAAGCTYQWAIRVGATSWCFQITFVCLLAMHEGSYHQQCDLFDCILGIRLFTIETKSVFDTTEKSILRLASISAFRLRMWVGNDSDLRAKNVLTKFIHVSLRHDLKGTLSAKNRLLPSSRTHRTRLNSKNICKEVDTVGNAVARGESQNCPTRKRIQ